MGRMLLLLEDIGPGLQLYARKVKALVGEV